MARPRQTPTLRRHKGTGQGYVVLNGRRMYVGPHDAPDAQQRADALVAEWLACGRTMPAPPDEITIVEVIAAYTTHAEQYYRRPDGTQTPEVVNMKLAVKVLQSLYGRTPAASFGPRSLKAVRQRLIDDGASRGYANKQVGRIRRMFKWATSEELIPSSVLHALQSVEGLKRGRTDARETEPVRPVPEAHIKAVRPHVSRQVEALIDLQLLTGARPGELLGLRPLDIDTSAPIWTHTPAVHKTSHRGRARTIYVGPRAQEIIRPFLTRDATRPMFSPKEAQAERHAACATHRRPGAKPNTRTTTRKVGDTYSVPSYARSIARACELAGVPHWSPNRLRHNCATTLRRTFGLEAAQVMLGHARADVTQVYAERDEAKAREVVAKVG